uniref:Uncharacterized protein n=1 Tax=Anguilla anguilla TaxID=7936 RepID=A0A0E9UHE4_ANGAN
MARGLTGLHVWGYCGRLRG